MRRLWALLVFAVLLLAAATAPVLAQDRGQGFAPPDVLTTSDITYPNDSAATGLVVVAVGLDGAGHITQKDVLRDIPSLTAPVLQSIDSWTFRGARLDGRRVASTFVVNIIFNPKDYRFGSAATPEPGKELKILAADAEGFLPPKEVTPAWAEYPLNSLAHGAVVVDARVNSRGRATRVAATTRIASLTTPSMAAARAWTFQPATFRGRAIAARTVIGYVFRLPNIELPVAKP